MRTPAKVNSITETVTTYVPSPTSVSDQGKEEIDLQVFPNPSNEFLAVQLNGISTDNLRIELMDRYGKILKSEMIYQGSTIAYFDTRTLYSGIYFVRLKKNKDYLIKKIEMIK